MKILFFFIMLAIAFAKEEMAITKEFIDELRSKVSWEVTDYEDSPFKDWTFEELSGMFSHKESNIEIKDEIEQVADENDEDEDNEKQRNLRRPSRNDFCIHAVKDQGKCASSWAITAASVLSDHCCLRNQDYGWLSVQELISCDKGNNACEGGNAYEATFYSYRKGLVNEECYPYKAVKEKCPKTQCVDGSDWSSAHRCKYYRAKSCTGESKTKSCIEISPLIVTMTAHQDLVAYKSGVYCWNGSSRSLGDHYVRCVSYDFNANVLKCANSWGTQWGQQGYFFIKYSKGCGIDTEKIYGYQRY